MDFARKVGIKSPMSKDLTLALGSTAVSPLEMANAYATFAAYGRYQDPVFIIKVTDNQGKVLWEPESKSTQNIPKATACAITRMMEGVIDHGTGTRAKVLKGEKAGKTGTSNNSINTWFMGFSPYYVTGVWVGFDDRRPIRRGTGGNTAAPIWLDHMDKIQGAKPLKAFSCPSSFSVQALREESATLPAATASPKPIQPKAASDTYNFTQNQYELLYGTN